MSQPKITTHILEASGRLTPLKPQIELATDEIIKTVSGLIDLPNLDIIFEDFPKAAIPETGVGGRESNVRIIEVFIDPDFKGLEENLDFEIKSTLAHEMNHSARENVFGYPRTLFDFLIQEGLADHFDLEVTGGELKPWTRALNPQQMTEMLEKAQAEFDNEDYNHVAWFFGDESSAIPRWAGYSLGFKLVADYLKRTSRKASEVTLLESVRFRA